MAGLLSRVIGGALDGIGEGMAEQAKQSGLAKREARLRELEHEYRMREMGAQAGFQQERDARQNSFQAGESEKSRTFQAGENDKSRAFQAGENDKSRSFQTGENDANRRAAASKATADAADKTYKQIVEQNTVKDVDITGRTVESTNWLKIEDQLRKVGLTSYADQVRAGVFVVDIPSDLRRPSAPAVNGGAAAPPAPRDEAQRKVGQVYAIPDGPLAGKLVEWTGQGWRPR